MKEDSLESRRHAETIERNILCPAVNKVRNNDQARQTTQPKMCKSCHAATKSGKDVFRHGDRAASWKSEK